MLNKKFYEKVKKENLNEYEIKTLKDFIDTLRKYPERIIAKIEKISKSGLTRRVSIFFIKNNELCKINYQLAKLLDYTLDKDFYIILKGCGMDVIFNMLYNLNYYVSNKYKEDIKKNAAYYKLI